MIAVIPTAPSSDFHWRFVVVSHVYSLQIQLRLRELLTDSSVTWPCELCARAITELCRLVLGCRSVPFLFSHAPQPTCTSAVIQTLLDEVMMLSTP